MSDVACRGTTKSNEPCGSPMVDASGYCPAHREGGAERMREIGIRGGLALKAKHDGGGFAREELPPMQTLEDAKLALDAIRIAVLTRKSTYSEGSSASKAVAEWVKADGAAQTQRLVNELRSELEEKTEEIEQLRKQLGGKARALRVAR